MTSTDLMNVSAFENQLPDDAFAALNPQSESLADGIGSSYPIVSYKGKVWAIRYRGETKTVIRPDDGSPAAFLDVIVLRSAPYKSKSYYEANSFDDQTSAGARPICASVDGVTPDADVTERQSQACAICPRNVFKQEGQRKGKDCSDFKRLAVLLLPAQSKVVFGEALLEPAFLRVPAASLNDLALLGEAMSKKGFHYSSYITRIGFVSDKAHPQMTFRAMQKLGASEAAVVLPMREDPQSYRITGENEVGKPRPAVQHLQNNVGQTATPANTTQTQASAPSAATKSSSASSTTTTSPSKDDEIAKLKAQLAAAEAAKAVKVEAPKTDENVVSDTGFGDIIPPNKKPAQAAGVETGFGDASIAQSMVEVSTSSSDQAPSLAEDTGAPESSDIEMDARIAALLN